MKTSLAVVLLLCCEAVVSISLNKSKLLNDIEAELQKAQSMAQGDATDEVAAVESEQHEKENMVLGISRAYSCNFLRL